MSVVGVPRCPCEGVGVALSLAGVVDVHVALLQLGQLQAVAAVQLHLGLTRGRQEAVPRATGVGISRLRAQGNTVKSSGLSVMLY